MELQEEVIEKIEELLEETKEEVHQSILRFNQNEEALNQAFEEKITLMQSKFETINDEQKNSPNVPSEFRDKKNEGYFTWTN